MGAPPPRRRPGDAGRRAEGTIAAGERGTGSASPSGRPPHGRGEMVGGDFFGVCGGGTHITKPPSTLPNIRAHPTRAGAGAKPVPPGGRRASRFRNHPLRGKSRQEFRCPPLPRHAATPPGDGVERGVCVVPPPKNNKKKNNPDKPFFLPRVAARGPSHVGARAGAPIATWGPAVGQAFGPPSPQ